jgi:hypothetical protein
MPRERIPQIAHVPQISLVLNVVVVVLMLVVLSQSQGGSTDLSYQVKDVETQLNGIQSDIADLQQGVTDLQQGVTILETPAPFVVGARSEPTLSDLQRSIDQLSGQVSCMSREIGSLSYGSSGIVPLAPIGC